ncbi:hypothetical protein CDL15_Pgr025182 [Punica granatum]|uniref:Subtilisin-like protease fibronectin type-III domain-containing protein n=1 Tax=Punica granatum TaxID=22663 RepID=A0A218W874_PUNGR|nr:hypothetical protein CDL15_Pgr025182 [Punica granatum]
MDDAKSDRVDILSLSIGPAPQQPSYFHIATQSDSFTHSRGTFLSLHQQGTFFLPETATIVASWILAVAASTRSSRNLTRELLSCPKNLTPSYNLNYPSIGVATMSGSFSAHRKVTYYGQGPTVYSPYVEYLAGVKLTVSPPQLKFSKAGKKLAYRIDFTPNHSSNGSFELGSLTRSKGVHRVQSPISLNAVSVSN